MRSDTLASGGIRANFQTTDGRVSQQKWDEAFENYNPEEFKNAPNKSRLHNNDASFETTGISGPITRKTSGFPRGD